MKEPEYVEGRVAHGPAPPVTFYWLLDSYSDPTFSLCDVCDECPACQYNPVSVNTQVSTVQWSFNYDCTITP